MPTIPNAINSEPGVSVLRPAIRPDAGTSTTTETKLTHERIDPNAPEKVRHRNIDPLTIEQTKRIFGAGCLEERISVGRNRVNDSKDVSGTDLILVQLATKYDKLIQAENQYLVKKEDYDKRKLAKQLKADETPPPETFNPPVDLLLNDQEQVQLYFALDTVAHEYMALGGYTLNPNQIIELTRTIDVTEGKGRGKKKVPTQKSIKQIGVLEKHSVSVDTGIFASEEAKQAKFIAKNQSEQENTIYNLLYEQQRLIRHLSGRSTQEATDVLLDTPLTHKLTDDIDKMRTRILRERYNGTSIQTLRATDTGTVIKIESEARQMALQERGAKAALDIIHQTNPKYLTAERIAKAQAAETAATTGTYKYTKLDADGNRIESNETEYKELEEQRSKQQVIDQLNEQLAKLNRLRELQGYTSNNQVIIEDFIGKANKIYSNALTTQQATQGQKPYTQEQLNELRDEPGRLRLELQTLTTELGIADQAARETAITTLTDRLKILSKRINEIKAKGLDRELVPDTERASQIKAIKDAAAPERINAIQSRILVQGNKEKELHDMDSLRTLLKLDYEILTDKRLRSLIGQMLGIDVRDIDDTAVVRTLKAAQKTNPAIPLDQAITNRNERAVIQQGMEENERILRELKLRSSPEVAMTLLGIIHERLDAAGKGTPTADVGFKQEVNLPSNRVVNEQTSALYKAGLIEGVNAVRFQNGINVNGVHYEIITQGGAPTVYIQEIDASGNIQFTKVGTIDVDNSKQYINEVNSKLSNDDKNAILNEIFVTTIDQHGKRGAEGLTIPVLKLFDPARPTIDIQGDTTKIPVHAVNGEYMVRVTPEQTSKDFIELPYDVPIREYMARNPDLFKTVIRTQAAEQLYALKQAGAEIHNTEQAVTTSLHRGEISSISSYPQETIVNWKETLSPTVSRELTVKVKSNGNVEILLPATGRGIRPKSLVELTGNQAINDFINSTDVLAGITPAPTAEQTDTVKAAQKGLPYALARHYFTLSPQERIKLSFQNRTFSIPIEFNITPNTTTRTGTNHNIEIFKQADGELMVRDLTTHTNPERAADFLERMNNIEAVSGKWGVTHGLEVQKQIGLSILEGLKQTP